MHRAADVEEAEPIDLFEALRQSVERSKRTRGAGGSLDRLTKGELEKRAKAAGIEGRSRMSKDELVAALRAA